MKKCNDCSTYNYPGRTYCKKCWGALYGTEQRNRRYGYSSSHLIDKLFSAMRIER